MDSMLKKEAIVIPRASFARGTALEFQCLLEEKADLSSR
jgi:hypothetical protein